MGLAIAMFSLCAGRARELSSRYVCGNGRNVAWETRNGISQTWTLKCRWGQVEDISPSKASPSYGIKVTRTQTWCTWCWLPQSRPTPVKRHDRFMLGIWLCRKCVVSRRTLRIIMGQEGCRVYHCCRHTMVSKLKLDPNEVPRVFVQKYRRSVLPKSLRTHPDNTPM